MDKFSSYFLSKLTVTVNNFNLLSYGDKVVVAVSGGVDSVVLLHSLHELRHYFGISLACASFDHKIRASSADDTAFVRVLCNNFSIPFYTAQIDVKGYAKRNKLNLEEAGRILRYNFLTEAASNFDAKKIATAHHSDDFAENFIMRLITGGGSGAIAGIPVKNNLIIRPFIRHSKDEIIEFSAINSIKFKDDYTNRDTKIFRNFIRLNIIPRFKERNKSFLKTVHNTAEILKGDDDFINTIAAESFNNLSKLLYSKSDAGTALLSGIVFNRTDLINLNHAVLYRLLKLSATNLAGHDRAGAEGNFLLKIPAISYANFKMFAELIKSNKPNSLLNINKTVSIARKYEEISITPFSIREEFNFKSFYFRFKKDGAKGVYGASYEYMLSKIGTPEYKEICRIQIKELHKAFYIKKLDGKESYRVKDMILKKIGEIKLRPNIVYFDFEKIKLPITIRTFMEGDRLSPLGSHGHKKLKSYFIDKKVPEQIRKIIPIVLFGNEIAWVSFNTISESIKIDESTKNAGVMFIK